jgi:hypothetical protein
MRSRAVNGVDRRLHCLAPSHVHDDRHGATVGSADGAAHVLRILRLAATDSDRKADAGQSLGDAAPKASAGAEDEDGGVMVRRDSHEVSQS